MKQVGANLPLVVFANLPYHAILLDCHGHPVTDNVSEINSNSILFYSLQQEKSEYLYDSGVQLPLNSRKYIQRECKKCIYLGKKSNNVHSTGITLENSTKTHSLCLYSKVMRPYDRQCYEPRRTKITAVVFRSWFYFRLPDLL